MRRKKFSQKLTTSRENGIIVYYVKRLDCLIQKIFSTPTEKIMSEVYFLSGNFKPGNMVPIAADMVTTPHDLVSFSVGCGFDFDIFRHGSRHGCV